MVHTLQYFDYRPGYDRSEGVVIKNLGFKNGLSDHELPPGIMLTIDKGMTGLREL